MHDALRSPDRVERLFPPQHALRRLVRPTFDTLRRSLASLQVSAIRIDSALDPSREAVRPSNDRLYGPGSMNMLPFIATWLSTGDTTPHEQGNTVLLPASIDRTAVDYMQRNGLLGRVAYVEDLAALKRHVIGSTQRLYSIDDLGADFDPYVVVGSQLSRWVNQKDDLTSLSAYAPFELVLDMYETTVEDFHVVRGNGQNRVFVKTNNTDSAGAGVHICHDEAEFEQTLLKLRDAQMEFGLNRRICVQQELRGRNCSFQVFLDPDDRDTIQIVALTDQLVENDGKTFKASVNHPINASTVTPVGPVILDMVDRIRARHPEAFGFLTCDYFEQPDGRIAIYDPGLRLTGHTATAMAAHFARKLGHADAWVAQFDLRSGVENLSFAQFVERTRKLTDPRELARTGVGVLPWGWNDRLGFGVLIGVAPDEGTWNDLRDRVLSLWSLAA